jgi:hypothetical protein
MRSRITGSRPFEKTTVAYESLHATLSSRSTAEMLRQFATTGGQGPEASKHVGGSDKIHVIHNIDCAGRRHILRNTLLDKEKE